MSYIYIGQYQGFSIPSKYIKLVTGAKQSHTSAFRPPDASGNFGNVIEAWRKGVTEQHWTLNHTPGTIIDIYRVECTDEQSAAFYAGMESIIGEKYDLPGLIWFRTRLNLQRDDRWFCSEAVFQKALDARIVLLERVKSWQVSPGLLDKSPKMKFVRRLIVPAR